MNHFESLEGQVLFIIYNLYKRDSISLTQKGTLKDYLIGRDNQKFNSGILSLKNDTIQLEQFLLKFAINSPSIGWESLQEEGAESVRTIKTIKSTIPTQFTNSISKDLTSITISSPLKIRKASGECIFVQRRQRKYLTQIARE